MREDIKSMTLEELTQAMRDMGEPAFGAAKSSPGFTSGGRSPLKR